MNIKTPFCFDRYDWLKLIAINTVVAVTLSLITKSSFWINLLYSQAIGISVASAVLILSQINKKDLSPFRLMIAIVVGVIVGITIATLVSGNGKIIHEHEGQTALISSFFYSTIIGGVVVTYFFLIARQKDMANQLVIDQVKHERTLAENNLKILQAQIEPHFLFNTLSNVIGLIDNRPDDAKKMLEHFTHYLRSSLSRTRESETTLGDEVAIIDAYLNIQKIRMGKRLSYSINMDDKLNDIPFPPLLIQPLVENSVRHGLEPEIDGGKISVEIKKERQLLTIVVSDTGKGAEKLESSGIGLNNVTERLTSIFYRSAEIEITENMPKGLKVCLQILLEKT